MSQAPRWYRKQLYEHKLGLDSPNAGYMDISDAQARRNAVEEKLRQDDRDFAQNQAQRTQSYLNQLSGSKPERK